MTDRRTKAQILEELERRTKQLEDVESRIAPAPNRVPEADAIAACVRALETLSSRNSGGYSGAFGRNDRINDVIAYLVQRYSFALPTMSAVCDRLHLDEASEGQLVDQLRSLPMRGF